MKVNSATPTTLAGVKDILDGREKEGELGYEQKQAQDYATKFAKHTRKESEALVEKLRKNSKITIDVAVTLVNVAPKTPELVRTIAQKDKVDLSEDEIKEIIDIVK